MSWGVPPWVYLAWDSLCFLYLGDCFPHYGKFQLLPLQIFFPVLSLSLSFPMIPKIWMLVHVTLSQRSLKMSSFVFILFSLFLFCSSNFHYSVFWLACPFFCLTYFAIDSFQCIVFLPFLCCLTLCALSLLCQTCLTSVPPVFPKPWIFFTIITLNSFSMLVYCLFPEFT